MVIFSPELQSDKYCQPWEYHFLKGLLIWWQGLHKVFDQILIVGFQAIQTKFDWKPWRFQPAVIWNHPSSQQLSKTRQGRQPGKDRQSCYSARSESSTRGEGEGANMLWVKPWNLKHFPFKRKRTPNYHRSIYRTKHLYTLLKQRFLWWAFKF